VTAITIIWRPLIDIISIGGGGGWGRGLYNRKWCGFGIGGTLLTHLLFFLIGVTEDDNLVIIGRAKEPVIEVTKESFGELYIP
jgi:hypothetical protein